jgi:hypothetical protein
MLPPHTWPTAIKRLVLAGAALLVVLAYLALCSSSTILAVTLLEQMRAIHP